MNKRITFPVAREGMPFILCGIGLIILCLVIPGWLGALLFAVYTGFAIWFFRDPERVTPPGDDLVICPADGRVVEVTRVEKAPYLDDHAIKVGIFMSPFNVHVNRAPVTGTVEHVEYHRGAFVKADLEKASLINEHNAVILRREDGVRVLVVQVAGLVARRIVCYLSVGDRAERGRRFGLIRFGSRVDTYLPVTAEIYARPGERVVAGETALGRIPK